MERKNKKGQIGNLQGIILTLVIVGILLGVAFLVLTALRNTFDSTTNLVSNETITPVTTGVYLAYNYTTAGVICYHNAKVLTVYNSSGADTIISSGNYTLNSNTGLFQNLSSNIAYNTAWNVTYTYDTGDDACQGVTDTINATKTIPDFLPILIIIAIVGILLAIVFGVLPKVGGRGGGETAYV